MHLQWLVPAWAWPLIVLVAAACAVWAVRVYRRTVPDPGPRWRALLVGLRIAACIAVLVALVRPLLVVERTVREPAVVGVVVEDSGSMALADRDDRPTRWRQALALAAAIDSTVTAAGEGAEIVLLRGNGLEPLRAADLTSARIDTPRSVGSDLPALVARARQRLLTRPVRALAVLTDGHSDHDAVRGRPGEAPLWFVGVGDREGRADRSLADLRHPDRVQVGEPLVVELAVRQRGAAAAGDSLRVRLERGGETVDERVGPAGEFTRWELEWIPREPGLAVLEVAVDGLDNERFLANNRATLAVDVQKDQARLLLLGPQPGWDGRFLAQAALAEPRVGLSVVRPGPDGPVLADSLVSWRAPDTAAAWLDEWDGVVLLGSPAALLPDGGGELAAAVRQGLGLLVLGAEAAGGRGAVAWRGPLGELLPVTVELARTRLGEFAVTMAAGGRGHPVLADMQEAEGLTSLPPLREVVPVRRNDGARVLLEAGRRPVLVSGRPGAGRVLWFGGRRLWELAFWQRAGDDDATAARPGRQLIQQMLLWTALGDEAGGVSMLGRRLAFEEGEAIPVAVRWRDLRGDPVTGQPVTIDVRREGEGESSGQRHVLRPDPERAGVSRGILPPLPPGRWLLEPRGESDPPVVGAAREIVVTEAASEAAQVRQDRRTLRMVAGRLGGRVVDGGDVGDRDALLTGIAALDLEPRRAERQARFEPAATAWWLMIALGLLAAEWLLRRRRGLL
ncbi:hypothetical protein GF314_15935 [bacterium]|nr:hypothetical protein [bacterium]